LGFKSFQNQTIFSIKNNSEAQQNGRKPKLDFESIFGPDLKIKFQNLESQVIFYDKNSLETPPPKKSPRQVYVWIHLWT